MANRKQQRKGDRDKGRAESTAASSLCLMIQTPQEDAQLKMLWLVPPPANHGSGMQGAFRFMPNPKIWERDREKHAVVQRFLLWGEPPSLWYSLCWSEYITVNKLQTTLQWIECMLCCSLSCWVSSLAAAAGAVCWDQRQKELIEDEGKRLSERTLSEGCDVGCLFHMGFWVPEWWNLKVWVTPVADREERSQAGRQREREKYKDTGWSWVRQHYK